MTCSDVPLSSRRDAARWFMSAERGSEFLVVADRGSLPRWCRRLFVSAVAAGYLPPTADRILRRPHALQYVPPATRRHMGVLLVPQFAQV